MRSYVLSDAAATDLRRIVDYYWDQAGYRVSRQMLIEFVEAFRFLARTPGAGHVRQDLSENDTIRFWPMRDFLIIYAPGANPLAIIAIMRGSQDVATILASRGL